MTKRLSGDFLFFEIFFEMFLLSELDTIGEADIAKQKELSSIWTENLKT